ncbi:hypothetical protein ACWPM1_07995 [Tsuneonella sp. HG249]
MAKALDVPGSTVVLNEPGILNSLAQMGSPDDALVTSIARLLARRHGSGTAVIVKPSNFANGLAPQLLRLCPEASAILMTNTATHFLEAIIRKGLKGRQWGRQVYLKATEYSGPVFPTDMQTCAGLTDLQLAGMGWLLTQYWFHKLLSSDLSQRCSVLHAEQFDAHRGVALSAAAAHLGISLTPRIIAEILAGDVFRKDAKTGVEFARKQSEDLVRSTSIVATEEIAEVNEMLELNARLLRIVAPLPQALFDPRPLAD